MLTLSDTRAREIATLKNKIAGMGKEEPADLKREIQVLKSEIQALKEIIEGMESDRDTRAP
jgi:hypothetical protein